MFSITYYKLHIGKTSDGDSAGTYTRTGITQKTQKKIIVCTIPITRG